MTVLTIAGEAWASDLQWTSPRRGSRLAREARSMGAVAYVDTPDQTGLADDTDGDPTGAISLAAAIRQHIIAGNWIETEEADGGMPSWIAAVEADDGRIALIRCDAGRFRENGDRVYTSLDEVRRLLGSSTSGFALFSTSALGIPGADLLDVATLAIHDDMRLQAVPAAGAATRIGLTAIGILMGLGLAAAGWLYGETLWELVFPPPPPPAVVEAPPDPIVTVAIDSPAMIAACDQALRHRPPQMPAWRLEQATCHAEIVDATVLEHFPGLRGRPALVLRWQLREGRNQAIHRRLTEALLASTAAGQVHLNTAWSVTPLHPVLVLTDTPPPEFVPLRAEIDRRAGPWADSITYEQANANRWTITVKGRGPLARVRQALAPIAGLEVVTISLADGAWQVSARPLEPKALAESEYLRLAQPLAGPEPASGGSHADS